MRILYVQYTNPAGYPPLERSSRLLADAGWQVLFLGAGAFGADSLRFASHPNITVKRLRFCPPGLRQKAHYAVYCLWVLGWTMVWRPDWIYASDPLAGPIALALSFVPGLRVLYHEHDSPAPAPTTPAGRIGSSVRRWVARRACCSVLPNQTRIERYRTETRTTGPVVCVWNCPEKREVSGPQPPADPGSVWLLYHGSIGPSRLPLTVLTAMANLNESLKLRIVGYETVGSQGYIDAIRDHARVLGIAHRIEIPGTIPTRAELFEYCRRSDIGLSLMPTLSDDINMQAMAGASNKAFDYMACGLALLLSDLPDWTEMFVGQGYGVSCDPMDPGSIEKTLRWLLENPVEMRAIGERGRQRILRDWNYETEFVPVLECLRGGPIPAVPAPLLSNLPHTS
jgi:glycosyltransferase involved in cell wall biosynthesis